MTTEITAEPYAPPLSSASLVVQAMAAAHITPYEAAELMAELRPVRKAPCALYSEDQAAVIRAVRRALISTGQGINAFVFVARAKEALGPNALYQIASDYVRLA